jgi:electron transport complex protein RnfB
MSFLLAVVVLMGLGAAAGAGLALANRFFGVEEDPRVEEICDSLPGANCGACGYPGCKGYAQALLKGIDITACAPGGNATVKDIARILGVEAQEVVERVALVKCAGSRQVTQNRSDYRGIVECHAAHLTQAGPTTCPSGCMGLDSCVDACDYGAIVVRDGVAVVLPELCIGDGACVDACPRDLIEMVPKDRKAHVLCSNTQPGKVVRKICSVGCTACKLCTKKSPAYKMEGNLAIIGDDAPEEAASVALACPAQTILDQREFTALELVANPEARERLKAAQAKYKEEERAAKKKAAEARKKAAAAKKAAEEKAAGAKPAAVTPTEPKPEAKPAELKPAEVKPAEVKPAEVKPAEVKPAEVKPAEVKPTEVKPAEVKPAEVKPAEVKLEARPAEVKPAEVKPAEVKPDEQPKAEGPDKEGGS